MLRRLLANKPSLTDALLEGSMAATIEAARVRHALGNSETQWRPGEPLKLLLVGYLGTRNTGADVRVAEMLRQFRAIVGDEQLELSVLTSDARLSAGYFPGVRQVKLPDVYPPFLFRETAKHHGVVACEGSMFKSKFANALTTLMTGALGLASAQNKLSLGYGAEAGEMDPVLRELVRRYCHDSFIVCRNEASRRILAELDIPTAEGTDTAWTFEPAPAEEAQALLRKAGWDGQAPILLVCPINPFWWPVRPAPGKAIFERLTGALAETHYRSLYYHQYGPADRRSQERYLEALAAGAGRFAKERGWFLGLVGMERLDRAACEALSDRVGGAPCFVSDEYDMFQLVAILRQASALVSSRYHAMVCSSPAGVPGVGVSMDERIANLLADRDQDRLCLSVDATNLASQLRERLDELARDPEPVRQGTLATIPRELEKMGRMGMVFEDRLRHRYPELPPRDGPRDWRTCLPPLSPTLERLLEQPVS